MEELTTHFATPGANILVSAPASNIDIYFLSNIGIGHSNINYTDSVVKNKMGTSYAAPIITGVIALILEANPYLGYRDVQEIITITAIKEEENMLPQFPWQNNAANLFNGVGLHFSNQYGFGRIDANAAVKLSASWPLQQTAKDLKVIYAKYQLPIKQISSNFQFNIEIYRDIQIEHVEQCFDFKIESETDSKKNLDDIQLYMRSPEGDKYSLLFNNYLEINTDILSKEGISLQLYGQYYHTISLDTTSIPHLDWI